MKEYLAKNGKQIAVLVLSIVAGVVLHYRPELRDYVILAGSVLAGIGIKLTPLELPKVNPTKLVPPGLMLAVALACSPAIQATASSTEYEQQLKACKDLSATLAERNKCAADIRAEWDDAGARPATVKDAAPDGPSARDKATVLLRPYVNPPYILPDGGANMAKWTITTNIESPAVPVTFDASGPLANLPGADAAAGDQ